MVVFYGHLGCAFIQMMRNTGFMVQVRHGSNHSFLFTGCAQERSVVDHVAGEGNLKCFAHEATRDSGLRGVPVMFANKRLDDSKG